MMFECLIFVLCRPFRPCILIFDSLNSTCTSRAKVAATLRDYLKCEFKVRDHLRNFKLLALIEAVKHVLFKAVKHVVLKMSGFKQFLLL